MRVTVTTTLPCTLEEAREQVMTSRLMRHVSWPLTMFTPVEPATLPAVWRPGDYVVRMRSLGVLPLGRQTISITLPPAGPGEVLVRDDGSGQLVRRWDHLITLRSSGDGTCTRYTDRVDVDAGPLTLPVWLWAHLLYRWRQLRWRRLARRGFRY